MQGTYKSFDKALYAENDMRARVRVMEYVQSHGLHVVQNDDKYGPDLVVYKGLRPSYYLEVEVKLVWQASQSQFPWETIQLPERKAKFLKLGLPIEFWILRQDLGMAVVFDGEQLNSSPLTEVTTRLSVGEKFYQIQIEQCDVITLGGEHGIL